MSLTDNEIKLTKDIGDLLRRFAEIAGMGETRMNDLKEVVFHIHALQNVVLSQSAARAHPDLFRLLGEVPE